MSNDAKDLAARNRALEAEKVAAEKLAISFAAQSMAKELGSAQGTALLEGVLKAAGRIRTNPIDGRSEVRFADGDGGATVTPDFFLETLRREKPSLFKDYAEREAAKPGQPKSAKAAYQGANPFRAGPGFNLTRQMQLLKSDPELAEALARDAANSSR